MRIKLDLPLNETLIGKPEISSVTSFSLGDGTMQVMAGNIRRDELGFIQGLSITGGQLSLNSSYIVSAATSKAVSYCVKAEDEDGAAKIIRHWYQFVQAEKIEIEKTGKRYFIMEVDAYGLGMIPLHDSVLYSENVQKTLDTYEDLIGSDEEQDESQGKAEEQEADNTAESRRGIL